MVNGVHVDYYHRHHHHTQNLKPGLGSTQTPIQSEPRIKQPKREAYHSPLSNAEVKHEWICK